MALSTCSSHVLDAALGIPAAGLKARLSAEGIDVALATDGDGRIAWGVELAPGDYRLSFATGEWFAAQDRPTFYPSVELTFTVAAGCPHYHVALLLSAYSYTTYRGS